VRDVERVLGTPVEFIPDPAAGVAATRRLPRGGVALVENTRFWAGEEANDAGFAQTLAALGDFYVNDAFGSAHRAHASTEAVARLLKPAVAGFLMEKELRYLGDALDHPKRPFVAVLGGAKISGKIDVIQALLPKVNEILVGGAMANTVFLAIGFQVGGSLVERDKEDLAKGLLARAGAKLILPRGAVVAPSLARAAERREVTSDHIPADCAVFDIDQPTRLDFRARILKARTVFWNGPMGVFETPPFDEGTRAIGDALIEAGKRGATTIVGGGDSAAAVAGLERCDLLVGAQDIYWEPKGAFTGAVSAALALQAGARATLVGHSERRHVFGETDDVTRRKVAAALAAGLVPLLCVAETLAER